MRVLVSGGRGFVGGAIVSALLKNGCAVEILTNRRADENRAFDTNHENLTIRCADLRKPFQKAELCDYSAKDVIIHSAGLAHQFAAQNPEDFWQVNVEGTANIADLAARQRIKHFILISSVSVYGSENASPELSKRGGIVEDTQCRPTGIYAQSKLEAEIRAREICEKHHIGLTILRLATVIGEGDRGNVGRLIETIDRRRFIWIGTGENYKSLIYKGDVAEACLKILEKHSPNTSVYNVTAEALPMREIVAEIGRNLGRTIPAFAVPPKILQAAAAFNDKTLKIEKIVKLSQTVNKWLSDDVFSGEKFSDERGFRARTPVKEAIRREVAAYLQQKCQK